MDSQKLIELLDEIDKSGVADGLVVKLSADFNVNPDVVKSSLKMLLTLINGISKN